MSFIEKDGIMYLVLNSKKQATITEEDAYKDLSAQELIDLS